MEVSGLNDKEIVRLIEKTLRRMLEEMRIAA